MQDKDKQKISRKVSFQELSLEEKQQLVGAFVWLIEQDKKQNPALYQRNEKQNDRHGLSSNS